ncbi:hypothetical protein [Azospirillum sp. SYSU D00513]|uniref:hypothetical protein n=1 Tax=Azospirillum sp. SYSU D00513 TaxID=2812561 RepID=UPI001A95E04B|nr:hypothetical protein [Azospirillum sp. SYSU D00513]
MSMQPLLFDDLPETERVRKPARRSRATNLAAPVEVDVVREAVPAPLPGSLAAAPADGRAARRKAAALAPAPVREQPAALPLAPPAPPPPPPAFEPAALTNAELRALVQALPDQRLAHLLLEAARELKRRVAPDHWDEEAGPFEPDQTLLRAARQAAGELSGEDA